ncbi:MAG: hypothetical protein A4E71_02604 [Smithella sp. PtaU1.Bin162]|nr:MAG: hypothetical protein A4E71_02604 [Smithella sp. PtaU1.Bin162]
MSDFGSVCKSSIDNLVVFFNRIVCGIARQFDFAAKLVRAGVKSFIQNTDVYLIQWYSAPFEDLPRVLHPDDVVMRICWIGICGILERRAWCTSRIRTICRHIGKNELDAIQTG